MQHHNILPSPEQPVEESLLNQSLPEMKQEFVDGMSLPDIARLRETCRTWCRFVSSELNWEQLIEQRSGASHKTLVRFARYAKVVDANVPISLPVIYRSLDVLAKNVMQSYDKFYRLPESHLSLLACAINHPAAKTLLKHMIPPDEAKVWLIISVMMHANHSARVLLELFPQLSLYVVVTAGITSNNTVIVNYLLERDRGLYKDSFLLLAVSRKNVPLAVYFLENFLHDFRRDGFDNARSWCDQLLCSGVESGNIDLFGRLLRVCHERFAYEIDKDQHSTVLEKAVLQSHDMAIYLAEKFPVLVSNLNLNRLICIYSRFSLEALNLCYALKPGCFEEVKHDRIWYNHWVLANLEKFPLVDERLEFTIQPTVSQLAMAINSGWVRPELVPDIIDRYGIVPNRNVFNEAARDEALFRHLMARHQFVPDGFTLYCLIQNNQIQLFDEMRETYSIQPDHSWVLAAVMLGDMHVLSRMIHEFGLKPNVDDAFIHAPHFAARRLVLEAMLVNGMNVPGRVGRGLIIESHRQIFQGLKFCLQDDFAKPKAKVKVKVKSCWHEAAKKSPRHFFKFACSAIVNPLRHGIDFDTPPIVILREVVREVIHWPISIPEREVIYFMLLNSIDAELRDLAQHIVPPSLAEIMPKPDDAVSHKNVRAFGALSWN